MSNNLKIGLVGCGRWGKNILRDLKSLDCEVVVYDRSDKGKQNATELGADQILDSLDEIKDVQGIVVAVDTVDHYKTISYLLDAHPEAKIFTEKPMCVDKDQAMDLFNKAPDRLFVMDKWRYHEGVLTLAKVAAEEKLGKVKGIKLIRNQWGCPHDDVDCVWILLPHDLSISLEILGYLPEAKSAQFDKTQKGVQGMTGLLGNDEHWISFEVSERFVGYRREITLYCEDGIARLGDSYDESIELYRTSKDSLKSDATPEIITFKNEMPLLKELTAFLQKINDESVTLKSTAEEGALIVSRISELRQLAGE